MQMMVVVVSPAYSRRSSGAINESLKSFWTRTPVTSWVSGGLSGDERGVGGGMDASFPTTLATLSDLKGMRSSSQFRGL